MRERMRYLRRRKRRRWQRWVDGIDPWSPRPVDYVIAAALFLCLALLYIGERSYAVQLNRRSIRLEERLVGLRDSGDVLAARATALADRARVMALAQRELGMVVPGPEAFAYIYYVPSNRHGPRARGVTATSLVGPSPEARPRRAGS
jgi:cell division protein FtsB